MKNILLLLLCIPFFGIAQTDYELEFNSVTQDYVEMPNASAVIANKTAFSISCWVNPQANTTHSGIMGFRNNVDADFYLLQLGNFPFGSILGLILRKPEFLENTVNL